MRLHPRLRRHQGGIHHIGVQADPLEWHPLRYKPQVGKHRVVFVQLDNASDSSSSPRNARKLIDDEKIDIISSTAGARTPALLPA